jgi:hypothetical protein
VNIMHSGADFLESISGDLGLKPFVRGLTVRAVRPIFSLGQRGAI